MNFLDILRPSTTGKEGGESSLSFVYLYSRTKRISCIILRAEFGLRKFLTHAFILLSQFDMVGVLRIIEA